MKSPLSDQAIKAAPSRHTLRTQLNYTADVFSKQGLAIGAAHCYLSSLWLYFTHIISWREIL
jgi:hypothetical protein